MFRNVRVRSINKHIYVYMCINEVKESLKKEYKEQKVDENTFWTLSDNRFFRPFLFYAFSPIDSIIFYVQYKTLYVSISDYVRIGL